MGTLRMLYADLVADFWAATLFIVASSNVAPDALVAAVLRRYEAAEDRVMRGYPE